MSSPGSEPAGTSPGIRAFRKRLRSGSPGPHFYVTLLGLRTFDTLKLLERVQRGLSYSALERLQRNLAISLQELGDLVQIPPRTLNRRREEGKLQPDESDRLLRISRVFGRALELFEGDARAARSWLTQPSAALRGRLPIQFATTDVGAREVDRLIGRLEYGIPA